MSRGFIWRWGGLISVVGLLLWLALTPLMYAIWNFEPEDWSTYWEGTPFLVRTLGQAIFQQSVDLDSGSVHFALSRSFFLVYLSLGASLHVFHKRLVSDVGQIPMSVRVSQWVLLVSLTVVTIADFVFYRLEEFSESLSGFGWEVENYAYLAVIASSVWYGVSLLDHNIEPSLPGWLLVAASALVLAIPSEEIIGYFPNAPVLPYVLAWAMIGLLITIRRPPTFTHR